jgi:hypothetical protein
MRNWRSGVLGALTVCGIACGDSSVSTGITLSGEVRDYFSNAGLAGVILAFSDQPPFVGVTSTAGGAYAFTGLLPNGDVTVFTALDNYRTTRNERVSWTTSAVSADQAVVSVVDANRQYTGLGRTPVAGTAVVFVTLVDAAGQPHTGIPVADITLNATGGGPVGVGPFIFGSAGDVVSNATLSVTTAFGGRARVAFLDVPPGSATLSVTFTSGTVQTKTITVNTSAGGATLVRR